MAGTPSANFSFSQLKIQAKELHRAVQAGDAQAMRRCRAQLGAGQASAAVSLRSAQQVIARENGFASWAQLKQHAESQAAPGRDSLREHRGWIDNAWEWMGDLGWLGVGKQKGDFSRLEVEFLEVAMGNRYKDKSDVPRLRDLLRREPALLETVGPVALGLAVAYTGTEPTIRFLLECGVDHLDFDTDCYSPLYEIAYSSRGEENLRLVFAAGVTDATSVALKRPHDGWPDNTSLLYWATCRGSEETIALLLEYGAAVHLDLRFEKNGTGGHTALQVAAARGRRNIARLFIERGAEYDIFSASALDDGARLDQLLGADMEAVHSVEESRSTPLHWAARGGALQCAQMLLERGAEVNARTGLRSMPTHLATGHAEMIWLLAEHGADLNAPDGTGRTPLHLAAYNGAVEAAEALIVLGANPRKKNRKGKTPLEVARMDCVFLKPRAPKRKRKAGKG